MSFKTKKSLGQHFLTDKNIVFKILEAINADSKDRLIEIGPGTGALTEWLYKEYEDLHVIEIDERAVNVLKDQLPELHIHQQDVLETDWDKIIDGNKDNYVVGNLPYYITSPILFNLLSNRHLFKEAYLMMQKEVAERLVAEPGNKTYGILSVQTQLFSSPKILFDVSANSFTPPPKVQSSVIKLVFDKEKLSIQDQNLKTVVRTAFNQRRKKLSNALKPVLGDSVPEGFDFNKRAERWTPETYAKLTEYLEQTDILS